MKLVPENSGSGRIEVHIRGLEQLFHTLSPSPFHRRSLDREAEEFVVASARVLPRRTPLTLIIHLPRTAGLADPGRNVADAIHADFAWRAVEADRELAELFRRGRSTLAIGLPVLVGALIMAEMTAPAVGIGPLSGILRESVIIGGWVAMWRPMEIFLYDWWPIRDQRRLFERLSRMEVRVVPAADQGSVSQALSTEG